MTLLGLEVTVETLVALQQDYTEALSSEPALGVPYARVQEARQLGHHNMLRVVAAIVTRFGAFTDEDATARTSLLAPLMVQQDAIAALYRQRRAINDIDPGTGETLSDPVEGDVPSDAVES